MRNGRPILAALFFSFLVFLSPAVSGMELSDSARVSILTCSPGEDLYSAFGHTGIRVTDHKQQFDVVFNYGTFNYNQPGFYVNFVRGKMRYMVAVDDFNDFMSQYVYEKRSVSEQVLNLSAGDKQRLFNFLFINALPENREYYYDFFWDNCATRPRDVFEKVLGKRLEWHPEAGRFEQGKTMHDMLRIYVHDMPWVDFGFDLGLGLPCEIIATPRDQTFLPDYLANYFATATIDGQPLVVETRSLLSYPLPVFNVPVKPIHLTSGLLLIGLLLYILERWRQIRFYWFDFGLFFIAGLTGTLLLSLWLFTVHYSVPKNLNMLWAIPTHAVVAFFLLKKNKPKWLTAYFGLTGLLMLLLLFLWRWNPQPYNYAFMPLIILLGFRAFNIFMKMRMEAKGNS